MTRRNSVDVDEQQLQEVVSRGIPKNIPYTPPQQPQEPKEIEEVHQKQDGRKRVNKSERDGYEQTYLKKREYPDRQMIYITKHLHRKLVKIVQGFDAESRTNVSSYIENIIWQHCEENKDLINGAYKTNYELPL